MPQEHQDSSKKEDTVSKDILSVFCVMRTAKIQKIEQAWKEKDIKAYTIEVHALKECWQQLLEKRNYQKWRHI